MEPFVPHRDTDAVFDLIAKLEALGIRGRNAAYLASVQPDASADPHVHANYQAEFRFMVEPDKRAAAASIVGLKHW